MTESPEVPSAPTILVDRSQSVSGLAFEVGPVLPVQFYDLVRRCAFLDGETRLVFAILEDAVRTYLRLRDSRPRRDRIEFAEVARWFAARTGSVPFSFDYVCEVLELEPELFRRRLQSVPAHAMPTKQLRSVGRRRRIQSDRYAKKRSAWES
jgi:hypothetical protein